MLSGRGWGGGSEGDRESNRCLMGRSCAYETENGMKDGLCFWEGGGLGMTTYEDMFYEEELKVVDGDERWAAAVCGCWRLGNMHFPRVKYR